MTYEEMLKILKSWDGAMFIERQEGNMGFGYRGTVSTKAINKAVKILETHKEEWINDEEAEGQRRCNTCKHYHKMGAVSPCKFCDKTLSEWEADNGNAEELS